MTRTILGLLVGTMLGIAVPADAQDRRDDVRRFSREVIADVQRLVRTLSRDVVRDVTRDLGRTVRELTRTATRDRSWIDDLGNPTVGRVDRGALRGYPGAAQNRREFTEEQTDRTTRSFDLGASGSLTLHNIAGDIQVRVGQGATTTVDITRTSRGRTAADAQLGLERVQVRVDESRGRATLEAEYPEDRRPAYGVSVRYDVTTPAGTSVTIDSISGDVTAVGLTGALSATTISGDVVVTDATRVAKASTVSGDVELRDLRADGTLSANSVSGDVRISGVTADRLVLESVSGDVVVGDSNASRVELSTVSGRAEYAGPLARDGRYELQSHSGTVVLAVTGGAGFELRADSFSGSIDSEIDVQVTRAGRQRRSLRGTVGDGSASVELTTFSGDVRIVRR